MSRDIGTTNNRNNNAVSFTSFFGGADHGRCVQLTQQVGSGKTFGFRVIQMTKDQVREAISVMQNWLDEA